MQWNTSDGNSECNILFLSLVVHLSNQKYKSCIRKPAGATVLCLAPCTVTTAAAIANMPATAQVF